MMIWASLWAMQALSGSQVLTFEPDQGRSNGKRIVLISGDEEYRSEEGLPQLARILSKRHGFTCTVLFSIDKDGFVSPNTQDNEPGLEALDRADVCVIQLRFRHWPDAQMKHFVDYVQAKKPIIALRTSTHAFDYASDSPSAYQRFGWASKEWPGGFGKQVLGENWVSHWGNHGVQATLGVPEPQAKSPLFQGVSRLFGTTDVYEAHPPKDAHILFRGRVLSGLGASDVPAEGRKKTSLGQEQDINDPMMPIVWTRTLEGQKVFVTTMGAATDLLDENLRRLLVNACYWAVGKNVPARANVEYVGAYHPSPFGFDKYLRQRKVEDF